MDKKIINKNLGKTFLIMILSGICLIACNTAKENKANSIELKYEELSNAASEEEKNIIKEYFRDSLNIESLYFSPLWNDFVFKWASLYDLKAFDEDSSLLFVNDARQLIDRIKIQYTYTAEPFTRTITDYLIANNEPHIGASIAAYYYGVDIPVNNDSEIGNRLLTSIRLVGNKAPAIENLEITEAVSAATLVVFYGSDCDECIKLMDEITARYAELEAKDIRIISISSDSSKEVFAEYASKFPWKYKLCDYDSFAGDNFRNYGIAAIPAMYLIDDSGIIISRCDNIAETGLIE